MIKYLKGFFRDEIVEFPGRGYAIRKRFLRDWGRWRYLDLQDFPQERNYRVLRVNCDWAGIPNHYLYLEKISPLLDMIKYPNPINPEALDPEAVQKRAAMEKLQGGSDETV